MDGKVGRRFIEEEDEEKSLRGEESQRNRRKKSRVGSGEKRFSYEKKDRYSRRNSRKRMRISVNDYTTGRWKMWVENYFTTAIDHQLSAAT